MKIQALAIVTMVGAAAAPAVGGVMSMTGGGGLIPGAGNGGGGTWNNGDALVMPNSPFESTVSISGGVASVHSITFTHLVHGFMGDLQAVLYDPSGVGHNIFVRPGVGHFNSVFGSGMNFEGTYTFHESGAANSLPTATGGGSSTLAAGDYNQSFAGSPTAMGTWESGAQNIYNTPLSQITGGPGEWRLRIYDWNGGDAGEIDSWTLHYVPIIPSPGALVLIGVAGLFSARRRRG